ncbi:MAG: hypothetical protein ABI883_08155 [Chthoniobacterales bacterium]
MDADDDGAHPAKPDLAVRQPFRQARGPESVEGLLAEVRHRFYGGQPARDFYRDRRRLLYALTWPAVWLERRALTCSAQRYHALVAGRLGDIALHGEPARYGAYFPAYLLKCLQDWFQHHGDDLYDELKHIRNALDQVLASARFAAAVQRDAQHTELLAATHRLIHARRPQRENTDGRQLSLF